MDSECREESPANLEEDLAAERAPRRPAEEDLGVTLNELNVTRKDLRKWRNSYLNLADGFSQRTQSPGKRHHYFPDSYPV